MTSRRVAFATAWHYFWRQLLHDEHNRFNVRFAWKIARMGWWVWRGQL